MKPIIKVENLGKQYTIGEARQPYSTLRESIGEVLKSPFKTFRKSNDSNKFWALKDVNFEVHEGEVIGIIGRNGAGKSTLLKVLSRITEPTVGKVKLYGRVASLLEVGTGFHPELTGRENIFLNGAILGMKRAEIAAKLDEIIDFAGIEKFIDTAVKHYSSGMYVRLAFAVAAHLEPEILIVDEVLAVGDADFQKKCLGKMDEVSKTGRTILFVSHDLSAVSTLTNKCIYLENGHISVFDTTQNAIDAYTNHHDRNTIKTIEPKQDSPTVTKVELTTSEKGAIHSNGGKLSINFEVTMPTENFENMALSVQIFNYLNQAVLYDWIFDIDQPILRKKGINKITVEYPTLRLYQGNYFLKVHLGETKTKVKFQEFDCCSFEVVMLNKKSPEWGWTTNVCQYFDDAIWKLN